MSKVRNVDTGRAGAQGGAGRAARGGVEQAAQAGRAGRDGRAGGRVAPVGRRRLPSWLLSVTRPVLPPLLASTLCRIADLLAGVGLFALAGWAVGRAGLAVAAGGPVEGVAGVVAVMVLLSLLKAVLRYATQFLGHLVAFKALELLRAEVFAALVARSPRVMLTARTGDLLVRATKDVDRIEVLFAHTVAPAVCAVAVPAVTLLVIGAQVSWAVAAVSAVVLLLAAVVVPLAGSGLSLDSWRRAARARSRVSQHVTDSVQGIAEVVGYGRAQERLAELAALDGEVARAVRPATVAAAGRRGLEQLLLLAAPLGVVVAGAGAVRSGTVGLPALAAAAAAVLRLAEPVRAVEELAASVVTSWASAERVYETVHAPLGPGQGGRVLPPARGHEVVWEGVTYSYPEPEGAGRVRVPALIEVSATARAGQWTCVVGASGSGKSTLGALVVRVDDPERGRVLVGGTDVRELSNESLRGEVCLVSQHAHLFRATVADNLRLARPDATREEMEQACTDAGVHEEVLAMPHGYETLIGERGTTLSGGQRQRLALARALVARPSVLVLDEFTSHLDPAMDARLRARVRECLPGATVVEVTHRLAHVEDADYVVVLDRGRVVQEGQPAELLADQGGALARLRARQA